MGSQFCLPRARLCPEHSQQLNYTSRKGETKRLKRQECQQTKKSKGEKRKLRKSSKKSGEEIHDREIVDEGISQNKWNENIANRGDENDSEDVNTRVNDDDQDDMADAEDSWIKKADIEIWIVILRIGIWTFFQIKI